MNNMFWENVMLLAGTKPDKILKGRSHDYVKSSTTAQICFIINHSYKFIASSNTAQFNYIANCKGVIRQVWISRYFYFASQI